MTFVLNLVLKIPIHNHILTVKHLQEVKMSERKQLWYVFTGMGSQWPGMGRGLMSLEPFARAIYNCAAALRPEGVDLLDIINNSQPNTFDNILFSFVGIAAVQVSISLNTII